MHRTRPDVTGMLYDVVYGAHQMLKRLMSLQNKGLLNVGRRVVYATGGVMIVALTWLLGCPSQAALGAEALALWRPIRRLGGSSPPVDLKGWYRVAVPPTGKLSRQQWHVESDKEMLVCDGTAAMICCDRETSSLTRFFHVEFRLLVSRGEDRLQQRRLRPQFTDGSISLRPKSATPRAVTCSARLQLPAGGREFFSLERKSRTCG